MPQYKRRPNGAGTAVKRGKTYQARVVSYWYYNEAGKDRSVTVSPKIIPILDARVAAGGKYLFPGDNGKQMKEAYFRTECFYPALDLMGLGGLDLVPYSCRHSFSNFLKNTPGSDTDKAALMGHTNANMTKYYQSADLASLQAITDHI